MHVSLLPTPEAPGNRTSAVIDRMPADVDAALAFAVDLARDRAVPGDGSTRDQWEALATLAAHDLGIARAVEPHLDAAAILVQAGVDVAPARDGAWGVFAAEGGGAPLTATLGVGGPADEGWTLSGTKPWCSLADRLDAALITAAVEGGRRLFAVELRGPQVSVESGAWVARGLTEIPSGPVHFDSVPAVPIGEAGWYLSRAGFAWGGIGVAACWYGGAVGVARTMFAAADDSSSPLLLAHLGAVDELLQSSRRALAEAAELIDGPGPERIDGSVLAKRVRATVARACEEILDRAGHALGPAPLAQDAAHAKRVADLQLYVRQHHAEKDQASLGTALAGGELPW